MSSKEMNLFKNEVLNKIRELETKFFTEISRKNAEINYNLTSFNEKVNSTLDSNVYQRIELFKNSSMIIIIEK